MPATPSVNTEIERKFLVANEGWRDCVSGPPIEMRAGYLARPGHDARILEAADGFKIAIADYAWTIPARDAQEIRALGLLDDPRTAIRIRFEGEEAVLTIKGRALDPEGRQRPEFNWPVPPANAEAILSGPGLAGVVEKTRWNAPFAGCLFTVDVFRHPRPGLALVEIELADAEEAFERPHWLGEEVTSDPAWSNMAIAAECGDRA